MCDTACGPSRVAGRAADELGRRGVSGPHDVVVAIEKILEGQRDRRLSDSLLAGHESIADSAVPDEIRELASWALPIQERHLQQVLEGSRKLAAEQDPEELV